MDLNITDIGEYFKKGVEKEIVKIKESAKTARGAIYSPTGCKIWEEPEDDYLKRMEEIGMLVIR